MSSLKEIIQAKLSTRKESGWRELCAENYSVKSDFISLVCDSVSSGKDPKKARSVVDSLLFEGVNVVDVDVLMRLK
jgi:hypothetical protein